MKNLHITVITGFILLFLLAGCDNNLLDKGPQDKYSEENVFQDRNLINLFVADIYRRMESPYDRASGNMTMYFTDEGEANREFLDTQLINMRQYDASTNIFSGVWTGGYEAIRKCNLLLQKLPDSPLEESLKDRLRGEATFLRAWFYMDIFQHFGRFPIVDEPLQLEDELAIPRASEQESIDFIVNDFESAAQLLPASYSGNNVGRATKGAAHAYIARLMLNQKNYTAARDAAEEVLNLNIYELFEDFSTLFLPENDNNVEIIFDKQYAGDQSGQTHSVDSYLNPRFITGFNSGVGNPSQNLVDKFHMEDGSAWNESPLYDPKDPYANRDPRFYTTFMYDEMVWYGDTLDMKRGSFANPSDRGTKTGYYVRKFLNPDYSFSGVAPSNFQNAPLMRLAEIYLIYAEAQYQLGNTEIAREYVNKIRRRVNMPEIGQEEFTFEDIIHERTVELAFEGQRFNDIRRWDMGPELLGIPLKGIVIEGEGNNRTYSRTTIEQRVFEERMYRFPIPLSVINKYPEGEALEQNPGW